METLESLCDNTQNYKAIAGPDFPYLKGGKFFIHFKDIDFAF